jgi:hypothetical protein
MYYSTNPVYSSTPLLYISVLFSPYKDTVGNVTLAVGRVGKVKFIVGNPVRIGKLDMTGGLGPNSHG